MSAWRATDARTANTISSREWCHCPHKYTPRNAFAGPCGRYHPTEEEDAADHAEWVRIGKWERDLLRRALRL